MKELFKKVKQGVDRPSAKEQNKVTGLLMKIAQTMHIEGVVSSTGFATRKQGGGNSGNDIYIGEAKEGSQADQYISMDIPRAGLTATDVTCQLTSGTNMSEAIPLVMSGDFYPVAKIAGTWTLLGTFQTIDTTKGLEISGSKLAVNIDTAAGLKFDSGAIEVAIEDDHFSFVAGELVSDLDECP